MNERKMLISFFWMTIYILSLFIFVGFPDWQEWMQQVMLFAVIFATIPLIYGWD
jgi:hypothetical protein